MKTSTDTHSKRRPAKLRTGIKAGVGALGNLPKNFGDVIIGGDV